MGRNTSLWSKCLITGFTAFAGKGSVVKFLKKYQWPARILSSFLGQLNILKWIFTVDATFFFSISDDHKSKDVLILESVNGDLGENIA